MRYAIFSDIHGNRQAWEAVLADMEGLEVQVFVCLGDVVGYGPCPQEVLNSVRGRTENIVIGNHDAAAAGMMDSAVFNPVAREAIGWTRAQLDDESLAFLSKMPMAIESEELLFVHAEITQPGRYGYIETIEDAEGNFQSRAHKVSFVGHTHRPTLFCQSPDGLVSEYPDADCVLDERCRYIVNVGSVGEPRDIEDIRARYVVYDSDTRKLYYRQIDFDAESYRIDLMGSGLETTPYFLSVFDSQQSAPEAPRAMGEGSQVSRESGGDFEESIRDLVVPAGIAEDSSSDGMPVPSPQSRRSRRRRRWSPALLVIPILAALVSGVIYLEHFKDQGQGQESEAPTKPVGEIIPWKPVGGLHGDRSEISFVGPPLEAMAAPAAPTVSEVGPPAEGSELPAVADVPQVTPPPKPMIVSPEPVPDPPLLELPKMTGLAGGLIFYASMDEGAGTAILRDLSQGGRDLERSGAKLGASGQVGLACRMEGDAMISIPKPLPLDLEALTISFWLQLPPADDPPKKGENGKVDLPSNLVSLHEYFALRLENNQIVADLDRMGKLVVADFPQDSKWHHVLVENGEGITTIWIDSAAVSDPQAEKLGTVPAGEVAVAIGSPESNFTIDEVAIWKRRFARDELVNLYRRGKFGSPILAPERTVAHWSFEDGSEARLFRDSAGNNYLGSYTGWTSVVAIAPNPIPLTMRGNSFAASVMHLAEAPEKAGTFGMNTESAFTYEGWVKFNGMGGSLGGTIAESHGAQGWRVAARRGRGANGYLAFMYASGEEKVQALAKDLPFFDGLAHHFAAVWEPTDSATHGKMTLYFDSKEVATASLGHSMVQGGGSEQFQIRALGKPMIIDELRFSSVVLEPKHFLTAGILAQAAEESVVEGESVLERRDREMGERKQRQREDRKRAAEEKKLADQARKRKIEERKAEEEAKRKRERLGID
jgi:predicted phosphodiesterase